MSLFWIWCIGILLAIAMSGCATKPLVETKIPVAVSCIAVAPNSPAIATSEELIGMAEACKSGIEQGCYRFVSMIHADRLNLQAYRLQAEAVMRGCVVR